jgi:hypothetical protein
MFGTLIVSLGLFSVLNAIGAQEGTTNGATSNLVIYVFHQAKSGKPLPVELQTEYGYMVINEGGEQIPRARFILAEKTSHTVQVFTNTASFEAALARLPKGVVIYEYNCCTKPTWWGLKWSVDEFRRRCTDIGIRVGDQVHGTCTCPD